MTLRPEIFWACAFGALLCFVALAILSKWWIEPAGEVIFDSRFGGYSPAQARAFLEQLSEGQRAVYLGLFRVLDTLFPVLLTLSLGGAIWLNTGGMADAVRLGMLLVPLAYLGADLTENGLVAQVLRAGPEVSDAAVVRASRFTQIKWILLAASIGVMMWAWWFAPKEMGG